MYSDKIKKPLEHKRKRLKQHTREIFLSVKIQQRRFMTEDLKQIASRLGLGLVDESKDTEICLNDLDRCGAKNGPFTSWFYKTKKIATVCPVFFRANTLADCRKKYKYNIKRFFDWSRFLEMPSGTSEFYATTSKDGKRDALIALGHELVSLGELDQQALIDYQDDSTDYILPQYLAEIVWGPNYKEILK